jgi:hypothetical protein
VAAGAAAAAALRGWLVTEPGAWFAAQLCSHSWKAPCDGNRHS